MTLSSCEDLFSIKNHYNANIDLEADLDCTGFTLVDPVVFSGVFDGKGHSIIGLSIKSNNSYSGLFAKLDGAVVQNLILDDIHLLNSSANIVFYSGLLAGKSLSSKIINLTVKNSTIDYTNLSYQPKSFIASGLVVGGAENSVIKNLLVSSSDMVIPDGVNRIGLAIGLSDNSLLRNIKLIDSYLNVTHSSASYKTYVGGMLGYAMHGTDIKSVSLNSVTVNISSADHVSAVGLLVGSTLDQVSIQNIKINNDTGYGFDNNYMDIARIGAIAGNISSATTLNCFHLSQRIIDYGIDVTTGKGLVDFSCEGI